MEKQILNLSDVMPNSIVKVVQHNKAPMYCIIQSCTRMDNIIALWPHITAQRKEELSAIDNRTIKMVEFNKEASTWSMTVPLETTDYFQSLIEIKDTDYAFLLFESSIEEVNASIKEGENEEISMVFQKALNDSASIKHTYGSIVNNSMLKLLKKF